jgi:hypothetical protein
MCSYNWTEQHPLLHTRAQSQAVCEQLGIRFGQEHTRGEATGASMGIGS